MYTTTFEEPRAWAVAWDGAALVAAAEPQPVKEMPPAAWQRLKVPAAALVPRNGAGVFSDPRSWALGWEDAGLADAQTWQPQPVRTAEEI